MDDGTPTEKGHIFPFIFLVIEVILMATCIFAGLHINADQSTASIAAFTSIAAFSSLVAAAVIFVHATLSARSENQNISNYAPYLFTSSILWALFSLTQFKVVSISVLYGITPVLVLVGLLLAIQVIGDLWKYFNHKS